jgi:3-isopropylmalate dehydrogenase
MALRYSLNMATEADIVDRAIAAVLDKGLRTGDIMQPGMTKVGTSEMGKAIVDEVTRLVV